MAVRETSVVNDTPGTGTYGRGLALNYGAEDGPFMVTRSLQRAEVAVTEVRVDRPLGQLSDPIPRQDAYMICLMIRELPRNIYWEDGRQVSAFSLPAGVTTLHDLRREPLALIDKPVHSLLWFIPQATLSTLADQTNVPRIDDLHYEPGVGIFDETIRQISLSLLPALHAPERVSRLFADHVTLAFAAHVAHAYGGMQTAPRLVKGGLAPWQERRSKELLAANLAGSIPLSTIAEACGLSVRHFSRAFRISVGAPPHAWLLQARVDRAMTMLRRREGSLSEIALTCGFADHSHFTHVFRRQVGMSPATWRRVSVT
jgi:AraC-like DNA-binding protein